MPTQPREDDASADSRPGPGNMGSANQERILLAKRLNMECHRFFDRWDEDELQIGNLYEKTGEWFLSNNRRHIFLNIIDWTETRNQSRLPINPLTSKVFRQWFRRELYDDFAERFRELHEAISMLAWLVGDAKSPKTMNRLPSARDRFRR